MDAGRARGHSSSGNFSVFQESVGRQGPDWTWQSTHSSRSSMIQRSQHNLCYPVSPLSLPSITGGPFSAVPGSPNTEVLGHFVLTPRQPSVTPATSSVASPILTLRIPLHGGNTHQGAAGFVYPQGFMGARSRPLASGCLPEAVWVEGQCVSLPSAVL